MVLSNFVLSTLVVSDILSSTTAETSSSVLRSNQLALQSTWNTRFDHQDSDFMAADATATLAALAAALATAPATEGAAEYRCVKAQRARRGGK